MDSEKLLEVQEFISDTCLDKETFVYIPEFPEYMISSYGRLLCFRKRPRYVKSFVDKGSLRTNIFRGRTHYTRTIVELMSAGFFKKWRFRSWTHFKDMNPLNVHANNLRTYTSDFSYMIDYDEDAGEFVAELI
jgi:hypothetical protein